MMTKDELATILNDLTEARDELNRLNLEKQRKHGELYLAIKQHPARYGLEKTTENTIEALINTDSELNELEFRIIAAKHKQGVCFSNYDLAKYEIDLAKIETVQNNTVTE